MGNLPLLAVTQEEGVVYRDNLSLKINSSPEGILGYKIIEPGSFVISLRSFQGGIEYSKVLGISSPAYTVLKSKIDLCDDFFRILFKRESFINKLGSLIYGIRDGKQITFADFQILKLPFPSVAEQQKIAEYIVSLETMINTAENKNR